MFSSPFEISAVPATPTPATQTDASPLPEQLLQQILEVQREQLAQLRATAAANDHSARWRALVTRWRQEFPDLHETCRLALPILERAYGAIIASLAQELRQNGEDALDSDFALQDFVDRYGMRLGQLGQILNLVTPLAESGGAQSESSG
jgi:hypothetical protein